LIGLCVMLCEQSYHYSPLHRGSRTTAWCTYLPDLYSDCPPQSHHDNYCVFTLR